MGKPFLIRKTKSVCPKCLRAIDASVIAQEDGAVFLNKQCLEHGEFNLLLSRHSDYYQDLTSFYFSVVNGSFSQRDYIINLTNRCNLRCPICLASAGEGCSDDLSLDLLKNFLKGKRQYKIDLMGAEPTLREDLAEIIDLIRKSGNIAALHTNGIKLADFQYLKHLYAAGMSEVHLQFDGFDDEVYRKLRGKPLCHQKLQALENLKRFAVPTDLVATIARGINELQMKPILDFGTQELFVREIFFLGCRHLGKAKDMPVTMCIMPDELIDILEAQTDGAIARKNILEFQRLYFALLSAFSIRKCFYIHHFILFRDDAGYQSFEKLFDLHGMQKYLLRFKDMKISGSPLASAYLIISLAFHMLRIKNWHALAGLMSYCKPFIKGFDLSRISRQCLLLGFISACDAYSLDDEIAKNCGKGSFSAGFGVQDSGAHYNVLSNSNIYSERDHEHSCSGKES